MATTYWIKLYHEILRDPKMARLPDRVWRRAIELFLLAGQIEQDGILPEVADIAWQLRIDENVLAEDLILLEEHGIITATDDGIFVTHFATRQGATSNAARVARYRAKKRQDQYTGNEVVTKRDTNRDDNSNEDATKRDTEKSREEERRVDVDADRDNAFTVYEQGVGTLTQIISDRIDNDIDECEAHRKKLRQGSPGSDLDGDAWVASAIIESVASATNGKPNLNYILAVTRRWREEGFQSRRGTEKNRYGNHREEPKQPVYDRTF